MNYITEDEIEKALLNKLKNAPFNYDVILCDPDMESKDDIQDGTGRASSGQCVLPQVLKESLDRLNPDISPENIEETVKELSKNFTGTDIVHTNYTLYQKIREGIKVTEKKNGKEEFKFLKLIDFNNPRNNTFTAVSQMWIKGQFNYRRPDVLVFINGLPFVFIELKNETVKIQEAYNKNLLNYKKDIPNLFAFNQICVLSNGRETRLGAFNADYEFFFQWLKTDSEKEKVNRTQIEADGISLEIFADGLLKKEKLIDYIENFILFDNQKTKIIAKNHQFLGVNNLFLQMYKREELKGKLGVFWHTQGSGKSYSMVMFARKVMRKITGNFSFLVITDRDDLDTQIHKTFVRTEVIKSGDVVQPANSEKLREYLGTNQKFVFTLIHKFRYDKKKEYPLLSSRNDIIVMVDEAHRTQYADLAENMRKGLPYANFVAFTGTPLLGSQRLTNQWFGNYVSEYNFSQAIEDGSTVPLFYSRRVPDVGLQNNFLDSDIVKIVEEEKLNDREEEALENAKSRIVEILDRDDRLEKIARDIAHHFPHRGFLGKAMVVSVTKYTAVKMYDKVQKYWKEEIQNLYNERNSINPAEEEKLKKINEMIDYMEKTQMAVVISEEENEEAKFKAKGLNIKPHRDLMNAIDKDGNDIEDRFKNANDPLRLVFVCAMWLTGFDVPSLSTLYLDKPMKSHTLMQAIARANRVYPNKTAGIIIDYVNVFKYMNNALAEYAAGDDGREFPVKDINALVATLDATIGEAQKFMTSIGVDLDEIAAEKETFSKSRLILDAYNKIVDTDDKKNKFKILTNTMLNLYNASRPEIFEIKPRWQNRKFAPLKYLHDLYTNDIDQEKLDRAKEKLSAILDKSILSQNPDDFGAAAANKEEYLIHEYKKIDLSKVNVEELRRELKRAEYKAIEIDDIKAFIESAIKKLVEQNKARIKFSERFKAIIDRYNAGGSENEEYYEQLLALMEELKKESSRAQTEGLTEEELELYDLLVKGKKLTKDDEQKVKLAAKHLFTTIKENREKLLIVDWYKNEQPVKKVQDAIEESLDKDLPDSYDKPSFEAKTKLVLNHFVDMAVQGYGWIVA